MNINLTIDLLRANNIVPKRASASQVDLFINKCEHLGLDPTKNELFLLEKITDYGPVFYTILGINGYNLLMKNTGQYKGCKEEFFPIEGEPITCTYTIYTTFSTETVTVYLNEYIPRQIKGLWQTKPHVMLSKVGRAFCARKAWPEIFNGTYIFEELDNMDDSEIKKRNEENRLINKGTTSIQRILDKKNKIK